MRLLLVGRLAAAGLSLSTFVFLFLHDSWHSDNLFLVPDLILCALLATAALLPGRMAATLLPAAFAFAAGVLTTSVASYAVRAELGLPSLAGAAGAAALAVLIARRPTAAPAPTSS
jgi:hypothetical protein